MLRESLSGIHVGGRTALEWHGLIPVEAAARPLTLYGWNIGQLPTWFTEAFPGELPAQNGCCASRRTGRCRVAALPGRLAVAAVSSPERALLELFSEVGVGVPLDEARRVAALSGALRGAVLQELLQQCRSVKTVRLCVTAGQEFAHPWYADLVRASLPRGSSSPWVGRSADGGLLVLPPI